MAISTSQTLALQTLHAKHARELSGVLHDATDLHASVMRTFWGFFERIEENISTTQTSKRLPSNHIHQIWPE